MSRADRTSSPAPWLAEAPLSHAVRRNAVSAASPALSLRALSSAVAAALLTTLTLVACDKPPPPLFGGAPETRADAAIREACWRQADETYSRQNREAIYAANPTVNSPFSSNFVPGQTDRGLPALYAHDQMIRDCIRSSRVAASAGAEPATPPMPPPQAPPRSRAPR
jgi:hypothetical protein